MARKSDHATSVASSSAQAPSPTNASAASAPTTGASAAGAPTTSVSTASAPASAPDVKKVGLIGLIGIVISAMVGGGIFDLPQNMAESASAGAMIIAWVITGIGMWFIANTFRILAEVKPELENGLYTYAARGFGKLVGFFVAYGYWVCNCFANAAYGVLIMSTLNYFFPDFFSGGNNWPSVIGASLVTWLMFFLANKGAHSGSFLNIIGTIAKLVPVIVFIFAVAIIFKLGVFLTGFWGTGSGGIDLSFSWDTVFPQVSSVMLVTLWLFIGIEGAVVISGQARSQKDVGKATAIGYIVVLALYILVSLLPLGVDSQAAIGKMTNPSMATIMQGAFGDWGAILVNVGVIISVVSAWLVWMLMLGQMPLYAARDGIFPKSFAKLNKKEAPTLALFWTALITQILLIACHFMGDAWNVLISITSVTAMPCYLLVCLFLLKIAVKEPWPQNASFKHRNGLITGIIGTVFACFLVYSAGLDYLMIACFIYAIGIPVFIVGLRQSGKTGSIFRLIKRYEVFIMILVIIAGIAGIVYSIVGGVF